MTYFPVIDIDKKNKSAFGEILTAKCTTLVHLHFNYNLNTEIVATATQNTGTVVQNNNTALLQTGATTSSYAKLVSKRYASYSPGIGYDCRFTAAWNTSAANGGFTIAGVGDSSSLANTKPRDGFFIGYDFQTTGSANFHVFRYQDANQTSINQTNFSHDKLDGTGPTGINIATSSATSKINVFRIHFQWLSAGCITFQIENPNTGLFETFHEIQYANSSATVSTFVPSFRFYAITSNFLLAANCLLRIPCASIMIQGSEWLNVGLTWSRSGTKTLAANTETNLLTIRNKTTYAGINNRTVVKIKQISFASDGTKLFLFRTILNATLTTPSYVDNSVNSSCVDYDTAGILTAGTGRAVSSYVVSKADNNIIDFSNLNIYIYPGDTFTISAFSTATGDAYASIVWTEDV